MHQTLDPAAALRGHCDPGWTLTEATLELRPHSLDFHGRGVPLREHDERRALRLARDVRDREILLHDPLGGVDEDERDIGTFRGLERAQLRVIVDPLTMLALAT